MKKSLLIVIASLLILSCKKDKGDKNNCTTDTASITGAYKITAVTYKASSTASEIDYFDILFPDACERDDTYTFSLNGGYTIDDTGLVCSPASDDNGTWSVSGNIMTIDGDAVDIKSFDCKYLVIVNSDTQTSGDKLTLTLTRQ